LINVTHFPNGAPGFMGFGAQSVAYMPRPAIAQSDSAYFFYCVVITALGLLLIKWQEASAAGRAWAIIRRSEASAMAAGVNVTLFKVWGFAFSGFLAGVAGGLLAGSLQLLDARSFPAGESVMIFALTMVGGAWHWGGAVLAAILYRIFPAALNDFGVNGNAAMIFFGAALVHSLMSAPGGLAGQIADALSRMGRRTPP
jgi:branched-chain amino acid transport system permease protein